MSNRTRGYRRGFLEARSVVAIIVILTILPLVVSIYELISSYHIDFDSVNDEISLLQLRRIMLISYDIDNYGDELDFKYHNDDYKLELINGRLILTPGYQVFLNNVDFVCFDQDEGVLSLTYERNGKEKKTYIYKEKGIRISDFSFNDDELSSDSFNDE